MNHNTHFIVYFKCKNYYFFSLEPSLPTVFWFVEPWFYSFEIKFSLNVDLFDFFWIQMIPCEQLISLAFSCSKWRRLSDDSPLFGMTHYLMKVFPPSFTHRVDDFNFQFDFFFRFFLIFFLFSMFYTKFDKSYRQSAKVNMLLTIILLYKHDSLQWHRITPLHFQLQLASGIHGPNP